MRSGRLRHRCVIEQSTAGAANAYGEQIDTWSELTTVWGEVRDLTGNEAVRAAQVTPEATVRVLTRYNPNVTESMRILFDGRVLYPVSLIVDDRKTSIQWFCREER